MSSLATQGKDCSRISIVPEFQLETSPSEIEHCVFSSEWWLREKALVRLRASISYQGRPMRIVSTSNFVMPCDRLSS